LFSAASEHFDVNTTYKDFGTGFRADNGFVPQVGYREAGGETGWTFRPKGFFSRDGGIWFQSGEPKAKPGFVCGMFTPVADTSDEHGKGHGTLLQWTLDSGRVQRWPVPSRMLHDSGNRSRPN
jgi:hypothetical protein